MKKIQLSAAILVLALASSCSKTDEMTNQEVNVPDTESDIFVITAKSSSSITRTELDADGLTVLWQEGDAMNLYVEDVLYDAEIPKYYLATNDTTAGTKFLTTDSGETTAEFAAEDGSTVKNIDDAAGTVTYFALTPYIDNKVDGTYSGGSEIKVQSVGSTNYVAIYYLVPATQIYVEDSYDPSVAFAYAKTTDISGGLSFDNLFGILRLNLIGAVDQDIDQSVTSITVTATSNLSGFVNAYTADDMAANSAYKLSAGGTGASTSITMDCTGENGGVALSEIATQFNIALLPVSTGLTIDITYEVDGVSATKSYKTSAAVTRSVVTNMNDLDLTPASTHDGGTEEFTETEGGDLTEA